MSLNMKVIGNDVVVEGEIVATVKEDAMSSYREHFLNSFNKIDEVMSKNENLEDEVQDLMGEIEDLKDEINDL